MMTSMEAAKNVASLALVPSARLLICQAATLLFLITSVFAPMPTIAPFGHILVNKTSTVKCNLTTTENMTGDVFPLTWSRGSENLVAADNDMRIAGSAGTHYISTLEVVVSPSMLAEPITCTATFPSGTETADFIAYAPGNASSVRGEISLIGPDRIRSGVGTTFECAQDIAANDDVPQIVWRFGNGTGMNGHFAERLDRVSYDQSTAGIYTAASFLTIWARYPPSQFTLICNALYGSQDTATAQTNVTVIKSLPCPSGCGPGICEDGICNCAGTTFTGQFCEIPGGPCAGVKCGPGKCKDGVCDCKGTGYTGAACDESDDDDEEEADRKLGLGVGIAAGMMTLGGGAFLAVYLYLEQKADAARPTSAMVAPATQQTPAEAAPVGEVPNPPADSPAAPPPPPAAAQPVDVQGQVEAMPDAGPAPPVTGGAQVQDTTV